MKFQDTAVAIAEVAGTMIDHITEMAIVTATVRTAVMVEAAGRAATAVGQPPTASEMTAGTVAAIIAATTSTTTPVGRSPDPVIAEVIADTEVAGVAVGTTGAVGEAVRRTIGPYRCRGMRGPRWNCSRAVTGPLVSTLIGMRTFRSRPRGPTCLTASKM